MSEKLKREVKIPEPTREQVEADLDFSMLDLILAPLPPSARLAVRLMIFCTLTLFLLHLVGIRF